MNPHVAPRPLPRSRVWFAVAIALAVVPAPRSAAQEDDQGFLLATHAFRRILHDSKFTALQGWNELGDAPERTLLVLLGSVDLSRVDLESFVKQGGAVLLATDKRVSSLAVADLTGHTVTGYKVTATPPTLEERQQFRIPRDFEVPERFQYQGLSDCLLITPTEEGGPLLFRNPQTNKALRVATNRPSVLIQWRDRGGEATPLATLPRGCRYDGFSPPYLPRGTVPVFAVSSVIGPGRILLLADHSLFINQMMLQEDNNNVDFTYHAVEWLKAGGPERRDKVLFVEDGTIVTKLDVPIRFVPIEITRWQREIAEAVNRVLLGQQVRHRQTNFLNNGLAQALSETPGRALFGPRRHQALYLLLALATSAGLAIYGFHRLRKASYRPDPKLAVLSRALGKVAPRRKVLEQRQAALLEDDNLGVYARQVAQDFVHEVLPQADTPRPPRIVVEGGWWQRWRMRRRFGQLWRLAHAVVPGPVSRRGFRRLLAHVEEMRTALVTGAVRLA